MHTYLLSFCSFCFVYSSSVVNVVDSIVSPSACVNIAPFLCFTYSVCIFVSHKKLTSEEKQNKNASTLGLQTHFNVDFFSLRRLCVSHKGILVLQDSHLFYSFFLFQQPPIHFLYAPFLNLLSLPLAFQTCQVHHSPSMVHLPSMFERKYHTFSRSTTHLYWVCLGEGLSRQVGPVGAQPIIWTPLSLPCSLLFGKKGASARDDEVLHPYTHALRHTCGSWPVQTRQASTVRHYAGHHLEGLWPAAEFQPSSLNEGCPVFIFI